jgi:SAM-dependent methyltransferase
VRVEIAGSVDEPVGPACYYEKNAARLIKLYDDIDMSRFYDWLHLSPGLTVLDIGSGSGRDAAHFHYQSGCLVTALEPARAFFLQTRGKLPQEAQDRVYNVRLGDFEGEGTFNIIWASASLMHCGPLEARRALSCLSRPGTQAFISIRTRQAAGDPRAFYVSHPSQVLDESWVIERLEDDGDFIACLARREDHHRGGR